MPSFGEEARRCQSALDLLALERRQDKVHEFSVADDLLGRLLVRALRGEKIVEVESVGRTATVCVALEGEDRVWLDEQFGPEKQKARGALFVPDAARIVGGKANLPWAFRVHGRFTSAVVWEDGGKAQVQSADALFAWSVLEPLFNTLFQPFAIREPQAGKIEREEHLRRMAETDDLLLALGLSATEELAVFRYGGGWHTLRAEEQRAAKWRLLDALSRQATAEMGARYRSHRLRPLLWAYYARARNGQAKRRQVLTRVLQPTLCGFFGGDWLAFLSYIGEGAHPEEQVVTSLPEPKLYTGDAGRASAVAAELGVPDEEVQRMLAAFWSEPGTAPTVGSAARATAPASTMSPPEKRVEVLRLYWSEFDTIHARQKRGMEPLWGLVDDSRSLAGKYPLPSGVRSQCLKDMSDVPLRLGLFRRLLSDSLQAQVQSLWGTSTLQRWPESIVTELHPHMVMAQAFGPALKFWHGCALTAWFLCEGPYSRTDTQGMAHYYRREIAALEEAGTPVDGRLFEELIEGEKKLGPAQPIVSSSHSEGGITLGFHSGTRRDGFERLRDIVTRYRRAWAQAHLEAYLRGRWEKEAHEASRAHSLLLHEKGKAPTLKQFAKFAVAPANHWFGGDVSGLYRIIGEKSPVEPRRELLMPTDLMRFVVAVNQNLGRSLRNTDEYADLHGWSVQLREALGRVPTLFEYGESKFRWLNQQMGGDAAKTWSRYMSAIEAALAASSQTLP